MRRYIDNALTSVMMLYKIVWEVLWGNIMCPILSQFQFLIDDTVVCIFEGTCTNGVIFWLVSTKLLKFSSEQATYKLNNDILIKGMGVKLVFTFSSIGTYMVLFIVFTSLNERNVYGNKHLLIQVKRLSASGGGGYCQ